ASVAVAEMAHEDRADRAHDVGDAVRRQRQQRARGGIGVGEEHLAEDQRGRSAVDEEVVVLEEAADRGRDHRLARRLARLARSSWVWGVHCSAHHLPLLSMMSCRPATAGARNWSSSAASERRASWATRSGSAWRRASLNT